MLARTVKAKGVPELEDINGWHGKALPADMAARAIAALGGPTDLRIRAALPPPGSPAITPAPGAPVTLARYALGEKVATRSAFGAAVAALAARPDVVVLDGEVGNSTHAEEFAKVAPDRYFEMFIAEQQLVAAATGLAVRGYRPFAATFAVFFSRAFDFIRMAGISGRQHLPGRLARRGGNRPGRAVPDGAGGHRRAARRARVSRAVPGGRHLAPCRSPGRWPTPTASSTCAPPAAPTR